MRPIESITIETVRGTTLTLRPVSEGALEIEVLLGGPVDDPMDHADRQRALALGDDDLRDVLRLEEDSVTALVRALNALIRRRRSQEPKDKIRVLLQGEDAYLQLCHWTVRGDAVGFGLSYASVRRQSAFPALAAGVFLSPRCLAELDVGVRRIREFQGTLKTPEPSSAQQSTPDYDPDYVPDLDVTPVPLFDDPSEET